MGAASVMIAVSVSGCAGLTDVVKTGPETYMIASHGTMGWSSGPAQKAKAFEGAAKYCRQQGEQMRAISAVDTGAGAYGKISSAEVDFRCVSGTQTK